MGHGLRQRGLAARAAQPADEPPVLVGMRRALLGPLVAVAYFLTGELGLHFAASFDAVTLVWPPTGIALVALFATRGRVWPWVAVGSLAVNVHDELGLLVALGIAAGNTLATWLAAWGLRRLDFRPSLGRVRDVGLLLGVGCFGSVTVSASVGAASLVLGGVIPVSSLASAWWLWWLGDGLGILFLGPLLFTLGERLRSGPLRKPRWSVAVPTLATLAVLSVLFHTWHSGPGPHYLLLLAPVPLMIWVATCCGPSGVSNLTFALVAGGTGLTAQGLGPFVTSSPETGLLMLEGYVGGTAVVGFLLAAARAEERFATSRLEQAAAVFDHAGEGIVITDPDGSVKLANAAFRELCDLRGERATGLGVDDLRLGGERASDFRELGALLLAGGPVSGEALYRRGSRGSFSAWETWISLPDPVDLGGSLVGMVSDISRMKAYERQLAHEARHDPLTGLMNRRTFYEALARELQQSRRHGHELGLLFIDLDRFKLINDTLGHQAGDRLLVQVGERLKSCVRAEDVVARLGGDEFTVLLTEVEGKEGALRAAEQVAAVLRAPLDLGGERIVVRPSIGAACYPRDAEDAESLMRAADHAMFRAKAAGGEATSPAGVRKRGNGTPHAVELDRVRAALEGGRIELAYQPVVDGRDGRVVELEALVSARLAAQAAGLSPEDFVDAVERLGEGAELTGQVFEQLQQDVAQWRSAGLVVPPLGVNLSGRVVLGESGVNALRALVARFRQACGGVDLGLELPEAALRSACDVRESLEDLRSTGVRLVLDGFGLGSSRLLELQRAPVDGLKLDRSLIARLPTGEAEATLCRCLVQVAGSLGLGVAAVGVETEAQRRFLVEAGCPRMQGLLFQGPEDAGAIAGLLRRDGLPGSAGAACEPA